MAISNNKFIDSFDDELHNKKSDLCNLTGKSELAILQTKNKNKNLALKYVTKSF